MCVCVCSVCVCVCVVCVCVSLCVSFVNVRVCYIVCCSEILIHCFQPYLSKAGHQEKQLQEGAYMSVLTVAIHTLYIMSYVLVLFPGFHHTVLLLAI